MRSSNRNIGVYFIIVAAVLLLISFMSETISADDNYDHKTFIEDIKNGNVEEVVLTPNSETPTGEVSVILKNGQMHTLYVADITQTENEMKELYPGYREEEVARESFLVMYGIPVIIAVAAFMIIFAMTNAQAGGGAGGGRMMNFGKSRAKMVAPGQTTITFKDVAGLVEEKRILRK